LLGTNCGIGDPDDLAVLNAMANELGIDTIETGATLAVLMEAGLAQFGDVAWMKSALQENGAGTPEGRLWAQGTARVGEHYGVERVPVIKKQAISAYDPRVIEATGVTMMVTAQGADHTAGNAPRLKTRSMTSEEIMKASLREQILSAATDSLGLCIFGRSVTNAQTEFIAATINDAVGTELTGDFFVELGRETLKLEWEFNKQAGFTAQDDELPDFFYEEALAPTNYVARFHSQDVKEVYDRVEEMPQ
jgi:aldehyde:ferredoxin oxidoreductase